jgi:thioredoxin-related protein
MHNTVRGLVISLLLLFSNNGSAASALHQFKLKPLAQDELLSLGDYAGAPLLLSFFEPACSWCVRQLRELVKLQHSSKQRLQIVALGIHGEKPALERVLARSGARGHLTAAVASPALLSAIGDIPATPYLLLFDAAGKLDSKHRGYLPLPQLQKALANRFIESVTTGNE